LARMTMERSYFVVKSTFVHVPANSANPKLRVRSHSPAKRELEKFFLEDATDDHWNKYSHDSVTTPESLLSSKVCSDDCSTAWSSDFGFQSGPDDSSDGETFDDSQTQHLIDSAEGNSSSENKPVAFPHQWWCCWGWTTVMFKNIPNHYSREQVVALLNKHGFGSRYDFLYMPFDFKTKTASGYAFINFLSQQDAFCFQQAFQYFSSWGGLSNKIADVTWSKVQGYWANIARYGNSSVMHPDVPDEFKPAVYQFGCRVVFPQTPKTLICPEVGDHTKQTTVMVRNIPNDYTREMLLDLLDQGYEGRYNFVYLPIDSKKLSNLGYAFVNLVSHSFAQKFCDDLTGFNDWKVQSPKELALCWHRNEQGYAALVRRYRNHSVMHHSVDDREKPVVFDKGKRVPFPCPTRQITPPKDR